MKLPAPYQTTMQDWFYEFGNKTVRCKKFNRRHCWDNNDYYAWMIAIGKGHNINPLIYIDIESCLLYCTEEGYLEDIRYFTNYKNKGYKYITVEGGNRHTSNEKIYDEVEEYREKLLNIAVVKNISCKEMHELYLNLAGGKAPNSQEKRTGIYGKVSDLVRQESEELSSMWKWVKGIKQTRMKDDEMVVMIMNYATNGTFGKHFTMNKLADELLDELYKTNKYNKKQFNYMTNNLKKFWDTVDENELITRKLVKVVIYLLTITFSELKDIYKIDNFKSFAEEFIEYFMWVYNYDSKSGLQNDESQIRYRTNKKAYTYSNLLGELLMSGQVLEQVQFLVRSELLPKLEKKKVIRSTNTEEFTYYHRKEWIGKNMVKDKNGNKIVKVRTNNSKLTLVYNEPEFKYISLREAFTSSYHLDHIIPKEKSGETTIENAELTSERYNRKKYNKEV